MKKRTMLGALVVAALAAGACSSSTSDTPSGSSGASSGSSGASSGSSGASSGSSGSSDAATGGTMGVPSSCGGNEGAPAPSTSAEVATWLATKPYKCWAHESVRHVSGGPHHGMVQTYVNGKLEASLKGSGEHPQGSAAVKEFYDDATATEIAGYAVSVKNQAGSSSGQGWYWYEAIGTGGGALEGQGKSLCVNCHSGGNDFVLIPFPLR